MSAMKKLSKNTAYIACNGGCRATAACRYGCVACGVCVSVCPVEAIEINSAGVAEVMLLVFLFLVLFLHLL